ncbi:MAG: mCpol domain-containing protein [Nostoc sp.]|uniref:mCpol domain-containing protein n=1 Tax=Nostoc sp. TaxID=1180 RepID=UPI002FF72377
MMYIILDGDDIGLKIEKSFMENDEVILKKINEDIKKIVDFISIYLVQERLEIIFSGADGIICKGHEVNIKNLSDFVKKECLPYTFSIGIGDTLKSSFLALRYAKSISKNVTVSYTIKSDEFKILRF